ncbi:hypothetical protein BDAP_000796 [Binucleata daphniae]
MLYNKEHDMATAEKKDGQETIDGIEKIQKLDKEIQDYSEGIEELELEMWRKKKMNKHEAYDTDELLMGCSVKVLRIVKEYEKVGNGYTVEDLVKFASTKKKI